MNTESELTRIGDALEAATARSITTSRRHSRVKRSLLGVAILTALVTGSAFASGLLTPRQVAAGMPAGAAIFDKAQPVCTLNADGASFDCTLAGAPEPEVTDFTDSKQLLVVDGKVAGGCVGLNAQGTHWTCYVGHDAVTHGVITDGMLGQPGAPGHG